MYPELIPVALLTAGLNKITCYCNKRGVPLLNNIQILGVPGGLIKRISAYTGRRFNTWPKCMFTGGFRLCFTVTVNDKPQRLITIIQGRETTIPALCALRYLVPVQGVGLKIFQAYLV